MTKDQQKFLLGFLGGALATIFFIQGFWPGVIAMLVALLLVATS